MRIRGLERAEAISISNQLFVSPLILKEKAKSSSHSYIYSLHLSLTFIGLVVSFARSENEESTKQKMKRILFAIFGSKIYITVLLFYFHF